MILRTSLDDGLEGVAAGVRVAGVEAEADDVDALGGRDRVPHPPDPLEVAGHRVVAAGGVLDQQRQLEVGGLDRLAPVVEALLGIVVLVDVAAVHDQPLGADRGGRVDVLLEQLAARDPDPVVGGRDVDDVRRVHVEVDARGLGVGLEPLGAAGVRELGSLVALRVTEEELHVRGLAGRRLGDRVGLVDVGTEGDAHASTVGAIADTRTAPPSPGHGTVPVEEHGRHGLGRARLDDRVGALGHGLPP